MSESLDPSGKPGAWQPIAVGIALFGRQGDVSSSIEPGEPTAPCEIHRPSPRPGFSQSSSKHFKMGGCWGLHTAMLASLAPIYGTVHG